MSNRIDITKYNTHAFCCEYMIENCKEYDVYEFGLYDCHSIVEIDRRIKREKKKIRRYNLFDSFMGLPAEKEGLYKPECWNEGQYSLSSRLKCEKDFSVRYAKKTLKDNNIKNYKIYDNYFSYFFNNPHLLQDCRPACYINIDCDLYISTYYALDIIFHYGLITIGCLIRYDDIINEECGELKAHNEFVKGRNLKFDRVDNHIYRYLGIENG